MVTLNIKNGIIPTNFITQTELPGIQVYPNPSNGIFYFMKPYHECKIQILNSSGQLILEQQMIENELDLTNYPKGIYFIKLISENYYKGYIKLLKMD